MPLAMTHEKSQIHRQMEEQRQAEYAQLRQQLEASERRQRRDLSTPGASLLTNAACVSFEGDNLVRLTVGPPEVASILRRAILAAWPNVHNSTADLFRDCTPDEQQFLAAHGVVSRVFKMNGTPWTSTARSADAHSRRIFLAIIKAMAIDGWLLSHSSMLAKSSSRSDDMYFVRSTLPTPAFADRFQNRSQVSLGLITEPASILINVEPFSEPLVKSLRATICSHWPPGIKEDIPQGYAQLLVLRGDPWQQSASADAGVDARLLVKALLEKMDDIGFDMVGCNVAAASDDNVDLVRDHGCDTIFFTQRPKASPGPSSPVLPAQSFPPDSPGLPDSARDLQAVAPGSSSAAANGSSAASGHVADSSAAGSSSASVSASSSALPASPTKSMHRLPRYTEVVRSPTNAGIDLPSIPPYVHDNYTLACIALDPPDRISIVADPSSSLKPLVWVAIMNVWPSGLRDVQDRTPSSSASASAPASASASASASSSAAPSAPLFKLRGDPFRFDGENGVLGRRLILSILSQAAQRGWRLADCVHLSQRNSLSTLYLAPAPPVKRAVYFAVTFSGQNRVRMIDCAGNVDASLNPDEQAVVAQIITMSLGDVVGQTCSSGVFAGAAEWRLPNRDRVFKFALSKTYTAVFVSLIVLRLRQAGWLLCGTPTIAKKDSQSDMLVFGRFE
ncbi:hypothetical protein BC831DRAFT_440381 [Entophlyctis helioformis]|nr:hypothetical protein BC831DRAFT_440381 [Entophlyctis helioformis]